MGGSEVGLNAVVRESLNRHLGEIENHMDRDGVAIYGPVIGGLDVRLRDAIEALESRRKQVVILVDTPGGSAEVVERMVDTIRAFYEDVAFIVPDRAMSAGTIFVMSGDSIHMDYFSRLGPIDPQVFKEDRFVPALSYLIQYERLLEKDRQGLLTNAEFALLSKFDLAELHQFEQARELSISLLKRWLTTFKFKSWNHTTSSQTEVTAEMREQRATQIATVLSDNQRWHSHGRGISKATLESNEINLRIDDLGSDSNLQGIVRKYHHCLADFMHTLKAGVFVHTRDYF